MSLEHQRRQEYRETVGIRLPPAIAAIVLRYAGYVEARVGYGNSRSSGSEQLVVGRQNETQSEFQRGLTAVITWFFWYTSKVSDKMKKS
jgi:hypothetical protein